MGMSITILCSREMEATPLLILLKVLEHRIISEKLMMA